MVLMNEKEIAKRVLSKLTIKKADIEKEVPASLEGSIYDHEIFEDGWLFPEDTVDPKLLQELFPREVKGLPEEEPQNDNSGNEESDLEEDLNQGYDSDGDDLYTGSGEGPEL